MTKTFYITDSRFKFIALILFLMWLGFMCFFFMKAEEITKDPCSICSKRMGENIICYTQSSNPISKTYYPNGSEKFEDNRLTNKFEFNP